MTPDPICQQLCNMFTDPARDGRLRWKRDTQGGKKAGDIAGWFDKRDGRWKITSPPNNYYRSRLVYIIYRGSIPRGMKIDYIDGDRSNDNPNNLRLVRDDCKSNVAFYFSKREQKYRLFLNLLPRTYYLGGFKTESDAETARQIALEMLEPERLHNIEQFVKELRQQLFAQNLTPYLIRNRYRGNVSTTYNKRCRRWKLMLSLLGRKRHLGYFNSEEQAESARQIILEELERVRDRLQTHDEVRDFVLRVRQEY